MAVWLRKVKRDNPQDRSKSKWYLTQEKSGNVGMKDIAKEIEGWSALSLGDVRSVLANIPAMVLLRRLLFSSGKVSYTAGTLCAIAPKIF
jgi:hypothetical protein